jgi:hypothetical protein
VDETEIGLVGELLPWGGEGLEESVVDLRLTNETGLDVLLVL